MINTITKQVCVANRMLLENQRSRYALDNISYCDRKNNVVVFKPELYLLDDLQPEDMLKVTLDSGRVISGTTLPMADFNMHLEIYRENPDINSLLHSYAVHKYKAAKSEKLSNHKIAIDEHRGILFKGDHNVFVWGRTPFDTIATDSESELDITCGVYDENLIKRVGNPQVLICQTDNEYRGEIGRRISIQEEFQANINMLIYFDKICRENGIRYSLTGGTLLGAVRHGGFIPWDDDIDVFLTRPEYDKLNAVFPEGQRYVLVNKQKDKTFEYVFSRLIDTYTYIESAPNTISAGRGLFLDICVVDGLPKSRLLRELHMTRMKAYFAFRSFTIRDIKSIKFAKKNLGKVVVNLTKKFTTTEFWNKKLGHAMKLYKFDTSEYVGNFTSAYGKKEQMHRKAFDAYDDILFENYKFMVCVGYEEYLTNIYGDYLLLPKIEKRIGHHPNIAYWK